MASVNIHCPRCQCKRTAKAVWS
ncbi:IS1 family transposase [Lelliottia nimipressuralis]